MDETVGTTIIIMSISVLAFLIIKNSFNVSTYKKYDYEPKRRLSPLNNLYYHTETIKVPETTGRKLPPPKPPVPSKCVDESNITKRSKIHLETVYIPKSPRKDINKICQNIVDKEYKNGYTINDINTQMDSTGGIYLFLRFVKI